MTRPHSRSHQGTLWVRATFHRGGSLVGTMPNELLTVGMKKDFEIQYFNGKSGHALRTAVIPREQISALEVLGRIGKPRGKNEV